MWMMIMLMELIMMVVMRNEDDRGNVWMMTMLVELIMTAVMRMMGACG